MKKLFIISLILLFFVLLFLGIYNFAFKKSAPIVTPQTNNQTSQTVQNKSAQIAVKTQKVLPITDQRVIGATFDKKNNTILYYSTQDGTTWKTDSDGNNKTQISTTKITGLKNVVWSPDRSKVLTTVTKDGKDVFYEYDFQTQKAVQLKDGLDTAVWDNLGVKIFYKYYDAKAKTRTLNIANPDGSGWQKIADITSRDLEISQIPLSSMVSFWNAPDANTQTQLATVGIIGGNIKNIFQGKYGADYLWAPNGSMALVSSLSNVGGALGLGTVTEDGNYTEIKNVSTLVSKCVWSNDNKTIYCALPNQLPIGSAMPNDYINGNITTQDAFWKIDTTTGTKTQINLDQAMSKYDVSSPFLSPTEDALYFTNKIDGKLYKLAL